MAEERIVMMMGGSLKLWLIIYRGKLGLVKLMLTDIGSMFLRPLLTC